jgi:hypothetical protein
MPNTALVFGLNAKVPLHGSVTQAMGEGFKKHGWNVVDWQPNWKKPIPTSDDAEVAIIFGFRPPLESYAKQLNLQGIPCLVIELGYLKRTKATRQDGGYVKIYSDDDHYQVGINQLLWLPPPLSCSSDRFEKLELERSTCRQYGSHILVCGQTVGDAQHNFDLRAMTSWVKNTFGWLRVNTPNRELVWRTHPKTQLSITGGPLHTPPHCDRVSNPEHNTLESDLTHCHAMVTINSTCGNQALLMGVPVFCEEIAIYKEVANTNLQFIDTPYFPESTLDYFSRLAYAQWTMKEMADGETWEFMEEYVAHEREVLNETA